VVVFEFLEPIPAQMKRGPMMAMLEDRIESASADLLEPKAALAHSGPA
jgi:1-acyl-sn-glycerol-3-phosphate acyltransferase